MKTDFHNKDFPFSLALKWRLRWTRKWPVREVFTLRFCRATLKVWPVKCMQSIPYIISCRWHLLTSIWKYSVILVIAESLAISIHKLLEYSRSDERDQLEIDRSQSFCLLQSFCYNPTLVKWLCYYIVKLLLVFKTNAMAIRQVLNKLYD